MARPFKSDLVIDEQISDVGIRAYHVGFDNLYGTSKCPWTAPTVC